MFEYNLPLCDDWLRLCVQRGRRNVQSKKIIIVLHRRDISIIIRNWHIDVEQIDIILSIHRLIQVTHQIIILSLQWFYRRIRLGHLKLLESLDIMCGGRETTQMSQQHVNIFGNVRVHVLDADALVLD